MTHRTRIKICGIKDRKTLSQAQLLGIDAIGLMFYPKSKRAITLNEAHAMLSTSPLFMDVVAVFVNPSADEVFDVTNKLPITLLQFHGDEAPSFCEQFNVPYIKAIRCNQQTNFKALDSAYRSANALLLDSDEKGHYGGSGTAFDWTIVPKHLNQPIILAGGLTPNNIEMAISSMRPAAVDVSGGVENELGQKDMKKIQLFIDAVKKANSE